MRIRRLLALARLAADIQGQAADLATTTALEAFTVEDPRRLAHPRGPAVRENATYPAAHAHRNPPPDSG